MNVLTPQAIRLQARIGEIAAAAEAGVNRTTLRLYEACPEHVKSPQKRWLLDSFYANLARYLAENQRRRALVKDGRFPEADEGVTPEQVLEQIAA